MIKNLKHVWIVGLVCCVSTLLMGCTHLMDDQCDTEVITDHHVIMVPHGSRVVLNK